MTIRISGAPAATVAAQVIDLQFSASDLTTALAVGTGKAYAPPPRAFTITGVSAYLVTAQGAGTIFTVDILKNGVSILSTKLTVDNTENTSLTAATPAVISDTAATAADIFRLDILQIGDGTAKGLIITINGEIL